MYTDGAYDQAGKGGAQKGGFGFVIVRGGDGMADEKAREITRGWGQVQTSPASPAFLGADEHTNNTAELTALAEALRWLLAEDVETHRAVLLRPDSEYVMRIATGTAIPSANRALAATTHRLYTDLRSARQGKVAWAHVKGHSDHQWNELADSLAVEGARSGEHGGGTPGKEWRSVRADGDLWGQWESPHATWGCEGRLTLTIDRQPGHAPCIVARTHRTTGPSWPVPPGNTPDSVACIPAQHASEITRVLRARHEFGTLNLIPNLSTSARAIREARDDTLAHLAAAASSGESDAKRQAEAEHKVREAAYTLSDDTRRKRLATQAIQAARPTTYERTGPADLAGLRLLNTSPQSTTTRINKLTGVRETIGDLARHLLTRAQAATNTTPDQDTAWLPKQWHHSALGDHLLAAGYIMGSRNYAHTLDPFANYGKQVRWAAHARFGEDFDDRAAYPTASNAMIETGRELCETYVRNKDAIHQHVGDIWFTHIDDPAIRKDRTKGFFNRLDNQGTVAGLFRDFGLKQAGVHTTSPANINVPLPDGSRFNLKRYIDLQNARTESFARQMPRMLAFIQKAGERERPMSTLRSYCLQEKEATSCQAKMRWADWHGHTWFSIEHDGLAIGLTPGANEAMAAAEATEWASKALGYAQEVHVKPMPTGIMRPKWEWAPRPRTPRHVHLAPHTTRPDHPTVRQAIRSLLAADPSSATPLQFDLVLTGHDRTALDHAAISETRIPICLPEGEDEGGKERGAYSPEDIAWALHRDLSRGYTRVTAPLALPPKQSPRAQPNNIDTPATLPLPLRRPGRPPRQARSRHPAEGTDPPRPFPQPHTHGTVPDGADPTLQSPLAKSPNAARLGGRAAPPTPRTPARQTNAYPFAQTQPPTPTHIHAPHVYSNAAMLLLRTATDGGGEVQALMVLEGHGAARKWGLPSARREHVDASSCMRTAARALWRDTAGCIRQATHMQGYRNGGTSRPHLQSRGHTTICARPRGPPVRTDLPTAGMRTRYPPTRQPHSHRMDPRQPATKPYMARPTHPLAIDPKTTGGSTGSSPPTPARQSAPTPSQRTRPTPTRRTRPSPHPPPPTTDHNHL